MTTPDPQYPPPLPYTDRACTHGYNPQACTLCADLAESRADKVRFHYWETAERCPRYWVRPSAPSDDEFKSAVDRWFGFNARTGRITNKVRQEAKLRGFGTPTPGHMRVGHFVNWAREHRPRLRDLAGTPLRDHAARMTCACGVTYLDHHVLQETHEEIRFECPERRAPQRGDLVARDADGNVYAVNRQAKGIKPGT